MSSYQGHSPRPHFIPNISPKVLPAPANCGFHYNERAGWGSCACRQFAVMYCPDKDTAKAKWLEVHMGKESV